MKNIFYIIIFLFVVQEALPQMNVQQGLLLKYGKGSLHGVEINADKSRNEYDIHKEDYKYNISAGYKLRLKDAQRPFFHDIDIFLGIRKLGFQYVDTDGSGFVDSGEEGFSYIYSLSAGYTFNYTLIKGLYAGCGIYPTIYRLHSYSSDCPVGAKIGYKLKHLDVSFSYNIGLFNSLKASHTYKKGSLNDWQLQLFIPF